MISLILDLLLLYFLIWKTYYIWPAYANITITDRARLSQSLQYWAVDAYRFSQCNKGTKEIF